MLKKIFNLILPNAEKRSRPALKIIPRDQHCISRKNISPNAIKVLYRLNKSGYKAFLVGGGVRDILLGNSPKDFDIATEATPEEVRELFGNCRLIGRRFRLAHVRFGREIIEVATFRASHHDSATESKHASTSHQGQILRDNVYGNQQEDALRRDFTINALYYGVNDFSIHDYCDGMEDLNRQVLRLIGNPATRYREDPVRMLRAARFAAKLNFTIDEATAAPIAELGPLLLNIPPARLFEEILKLFLSGQALVTFKTLKHLDLFKFLFPATNQLLVANTPCAAALIHEALANTDYRIKTGKPVTPAFLFAAILWPVFFQQRQLCLEDGLPPLPAMHRAAQAVTEIQVKHTALPRRFSQPMKEIWELQERLPRRHGKNIDTLTEHPRFRAAYDFLLLREASGEDLNGLGSWWTEYQQNNPDKCAAQDHNPSDKPRRSRRPRRYQNNNKNS